MTHLKVRISIVFYSVGLFYIILSRKFRWGREFTSAINLSTFGGFGGLNKEQKYQTGVVVRKLHLEELHRSPLGDPLGS